MSYILKMKNIRISDVSNNNYELEKLYKENIKLDEGEAAYYRRILGYFIQFLFGVMKTQCPEFAQLYENIYNGGSYFDWIFAVFGL